MDFVQLNNCFTLCTKKFKHSLYTTQQSKENTKEVWNPFGNERKFVDESLRNFSLSSASEVEYPDDCSIK